MVEDKGCFECTHVVERIQSAHTHVRGRAESIGVDLVAVGATVVWGMGSLVVVHFVVHHIGCVIVVRGVVHKLVDHKVADRMVAVRTAAAHSARVALVRFVAAAARVEEEADDG